MKHGNKTCNMEIKHETLQQNMKHGNRIYNTATQRVTFQQNMKHDNKACKIQLCNKDYLRHIAIAVGGD